MSAFFQSLISDLKLNECPRITQKCTGFPRQHCCKAAPHGTMEFTCFLTFGKTVTAYKAMDEQTPSSLRDLGLHASVAYSSMIMRDMRV